MSTFRHHRDPGRVVRLREHRELFLERRLEGPPEIGLIMNAKCVGCGVRCPVCQVSAVDTVKKTFVSVFITSRHILNIYSGMTLS